MTVFTESQLKRLKDHKYCSEGRSISEFIFQPFWNYVVTLMPLWLAPNLITILGLIVNVVTSVLILVYSPKADSDDVPSYVFFLCAIGLFMYQTLDAIDGKQARRTNTSSPMGELFDHGCDAISTLFLSTSVACALSLGTYPKYLFFFFVNNVAIFYLAHWQTYCFGKLMFGKFDVTEAQVQSMIIYILAGLYGPRFFRQEVTIFQFTLPIAKLIVLFVAVAAVIYCYLAFSKIFKGGVGKNGTTIAQTSVLSPVVPLGIVIACAFYLYKHSGEFLFHTSPVLFMTVFGFATAKITCNLVIASMSKSPLDMLDSTMLGPILLACYNYFGVQTLLSLFGMGNLLTESMLLMALFAYTVLNFVVFAVQVCREISANFGIAIFSIPYEKPKSKKN